MFSIQKQNESGCEVCGGRGGYLVTVHGMPRPMCGRCMVDALKSVLTTEWNTEKTNKQRRMEGKVPLNKSWEVMTIDG